MMNKFLSTAVKGVQNLAPYIPGKPIEEIEREYHISDVVKLASNENPYGPSSRVLNKLSELVSTGLQISRYPDGSGYQLKSLLAQQLTILPDQITLGNGSNDVLDIITRCFAGVGDEVIFSEYAFAVYPICTQAVGATAVISKANQWGHDLDTMLKACNKKTKLIFIANPNNPTGTYLSGDELYAFLKKAPQHIVIVIDEAYMEYANHQSSPYQDYKPAHTWLNEFENLIVTRTFSKAYALAGLRIGYGLSSSSIADLLNRLRQPFNNNQLALSAAEIAIGDQEYLNKILTQCWQQMAFVITNIEQLGLNYIHSAGNFLCVDVSTFNKYSDTQQVYNQLLKQGIITRPIGNYNMPKHLRITIGTEIENLKLINAFKSLLK